MTDKKFILFSDQIIKIDDIYRIYKYNIQHFYVIECLVKDHKIISPEYFDIIEERDKRFDELVNLLCVKEDN